MKKLLRVMLVLGLVVALFASALAEETDLGLPRPAYSSLTDKLVKQLAIGSGIKGNVTFEMMGDTFLSSLLGEGVADVTLDFTHILSDTASEATQTVVQVKQGDETLATLNVDQREDALLLSGDLVGNRALVLQLTNLLGNLFPGQNDTPAWETVMLKLFAGDDQMWRQDMITALDPYRLQMELWLSGYANILNESGKIIFDYLIPAKDFVNQIKSVLTEIMADTAVRVMLEKKLTQAELDAYFNPAHAQFYGLVLDNLVAEGDIIISQDMSTVGEAGILKMTLPIVSNVYGIKNLEIETRESITDIAAQGEAGTYRLTLETVSPQKTQGFVGFVPVMTDGQYETAPIAIAFTYETEEKQWTDEEAKQNLTYSHQLTIAPDFSKIEAASEAERERLSLDYLDFLETTFSAVISYRSGTAQTSPITVHLELAEVQEDARFALTLDGKTASPWQIEQRSWADGQGEDANEMQAEAVNALLDFLRRLTPALGE